jgi:hypothetical protein
MMRKGKDETEGGALVIYMRAARFQISSGRLLHRAKQGLSGIIQAGGEALP